MPKMYKNIYRAIRANRTRFLMIAFVIAVGITTFNGFITSFVNLDLSYKSAFKEHDMASFTVQTANPSGTGSDAWIDYDNLTRFLNDYKEQEEPRIEKFELRIVYDVTFEIRGNRQYGRIIAYNTEYMNGSFREKPDVNGYKLLSGSGFDVSSTYRNVCLLEDHLADYWSLEDGDFIGIGKEKVNFQVLGSLASPEYLLNTGSYEDLLPSPRRFGVIFMPLRAAQQLFGVQGKVNEISVLLDPDLAIGVREKIADNLKDYLEQEHDLKLSDPLDFYYQPAYYFLRMDMEEAREMGYALPVVIMGMAMGGLYVLTGRMVVAERKDIGVSQALGYSRRYIVGHYVGIALAIAMFGTIIGTVVGVLFASQFSVLYLDALGIRFGTKRTIDWFVVGTGMGLGLLTGLVAGYFPVRNAIQPVPAESLRFDPSLHITTGKKPLLERFFEIIGLKLKTTGFKLPIRNFFRSKRRTFSSVIGVVISVSLISMGLGMMDSMTITLDIQYETVEDWDLKIDYAEVPTNSSKIVDDLNSLDGVQATYRMVSGAMITSNNSGEDKLVQLVGLKEGPDGYLGHNFVYEKGEFDPDGVVISLPVAKKLKVGINDNVSLEMPRLTKLVSTTPLRAHFEMVNFSFRITGIVDEFNGLVAYLSFDRLKEAMFPNFSGEPATSVFIKVVNPSLERVNDIRDYIEENLSYNVKIISTTNEENIELRRMLDLLYLLMYLIAIFAILLAMAVVYNTIYVNLQERKRELATLLTMGTPNRKIISSVTIESVIVTIIGSIIGLLFGWFLLWFFMVFILDMEFFRIRLIMSTTTIIASTVMTLIGVLIAEWFPLRGILNLNLAEATKERVV
ncbi:MAG: ABC transporter permease [Candidatus Odinarchaeota archaeon]